MSREEHAWALNELDAVVKKHMPRVMAAVTIYIILSIIPWALYPLLLQTTHYFNPWFIAVPITLQMLNLAGFIWYSRKKRACFRAAIAEKVQALNAHFAGRGINFVSKMSDHVQRGMDKVVIEVAARSTPVAQPMPQMHIPQMYPGMVNAVHMEHLPAHAVAIPMHNYAQQQQQYASYAAEYFPSEADRENAGLLHKM